MLFLLIFVDPHFDASCIFKSGKSDFSPPSDSDMVISDIQSFDSGACWTVSFPKELHCIAENNFLLLQKQRFCCKKALLANCRNDSMKPGSGIQVEGTVDNLLQYGAFDYGEIITVSFLNDRNDDSVTTSGFEDDETSESIFNEEEYSDLESFSSYLDDSDDLEVVFDDTVDASSTMLKECCHFLHTDDPFEITNGLDTMQNFCQGDFFPSVAKGCQCVTVKDIINFSESGGPEEFLKHPGKEHCIEFACGLDCPGKSNISSNLKDNTEKINKKTVSFAAQEQLVTVHPMVKWNFAYRNARKGPWERYACDRYHFQSRIQSCEKVLGPILEKKYHCYLNANVQ